MKSILQEDTARCFVCEENPCGDPLDKHHIFGGALRKKSEQYGLFVYLHHARCHIFGEDSAHKSRKIRHKLEKLAKEKAMEIYGWTDKEFNQIFRGVITDDEQSNFDGAADQSSGAAAHKRRNAGGELFHRN